MTDSKIKAAYTGVDRRAPRAEKAATGATADSYRNLLRRGAKIGGRHAAITTELYSWHSYKNWAEKIRGSWEHKK